MSRHNAVNPLPWRTNAEVVDANECEYRMKVHGWDLSIGLVLVARSTVPANLLPIKNGDTLKVTVTQHEDGSMTYGEWEKNPE